MGAESPPKPKTEAQTGGTPRGSDPVLDRAEDCMRLAPDEKGQCAIDGGTRLVQEGRLVEREMVASVERIKAIDGQRGTKVDPADAFLTDLLSFFQNPLTGRSRDELLSLGVTYISLVVVFVVLGLAILHIRRSVR